MVHPRRLLLVAFRLESVTTDGPDPMSELWDRFTRPPDEARPRVWWHWMDGNVDPIGIDRDLRWLYEVGIRGVHMFDGAMGMPAVVPRPVRPGLGATG